MRHGNFTGMYLKAQVVQKDSKRPKLCNILEESI